MKIELKEIAVRDLVAGYVDNDEEGVIGLLIQSEEKLMLTLQNRYLIKR
jgi:hypothetical protein